MKHLDRVVVLMVCGLLLASAAGCTGERSAEKDEAAPAESTPSGTEMAPPPAEAAPVQPVGATPPQPAQPSKPAPAPAPRPTAAPAPTPPPPPPPLIVTLPAGTSISASFADDISSNGSQVGDRVRAHVVDDVVQGGVAVIPAGSMVVGSVTEAVALTKKIGGRAKLTVAFTSIELPSGGTATIRAAFAEQGKSETKKDAATIGGSAAGGAILGSVIKDDDKKKGALIGAVVGAAAGTAVAMKTEGKEIEMPAGTVITVVLEQPAEVTVRQ